MKILVPVLLLFMVGCSKPEPKPVPVSKARTEAVSCVANPSEWCPSEDWFKSYDELMDLNAKYKVPQKEQDYINGLAARLRTEIPQGYNWDEKKLRAVKVDPAPMPTPEGKK